MSFRLIQIFSALSLLATTVVAEEQQWLRFRGVNGSGVNDAKPLPTELSNSNQIWSVEV